MVVKRVGVIGGGQLAWMMAGAAANLDLKLIIQTPSPQDPAVTIADNVIFAPIDDAAATAQLATRCDVITFENEFINLEALQALATQGVIFRPHLDVLAPLLDKYAQRSYLQSIGLPVPRFASLTSSKNLLNNPQLAEFGFPLVLKARRHGYDGQGTFIIKNLEELAQLSQSLSQLSLLIEEFVPFERELAVMAARGVNGEIVVYPVVETKQENQVCRWVIAPASVSPEVSLQVEAIARNLVEKLDFVGIFGIELFLTADNKVLVNEIAPRTHNSGHYTLDASVTSQFEMQLRAVAGLALGSPQLKSAGAIMVNLLGYEHSFADYQSKRERIAAIPQAYLHWYSKAESRPGRKLGHVTVLLSEESLANAQQIAQAIETIWYTSEIGSEKF